VERDVLDTGVARSLRSCSDERRGYKRSGRSRIWLATGTTDMHKGFTGLSALV
jgi:hypothetical protein